jgi:hypothetical protein
MSILRHAAPRLGLLAILLTSTPIEGLSSLAVPSGVNTCCDEQPAEDATDPSSQAEQPSDDGCCPSDCHGCVLKCCAGFISLRPARVTLLTGVACRTAAPEAGRAPASQPLAPLERPPKR